jgi:hypothetical protein
MVVVDTPVVGVMQVMWIAGFILHDAHIFSAQAIATEVIIKYNFFLKHHHQLTSLPVRLKEIIGAAQFIYALPAASGMWLHIGRPTNVIKNLIPAQRKFQVRERGPRGHRRPG